MVVTKVRPIKTTITKKKKKEERNKEKFKLLLNCKKCRNPSIRLITQLLPPLMLRLLILYMSGGTYSLKSTTNDRFLRIYPWQF